MLLLLFAGGPAPTLVSAFQRCSLRLFPRLQLVVFVDGIFLLRALIYHLNALCLFRLPFLLLLLGGQDGSGRDGLLFLQKLLVLVGEDGGACLGLVELSGALFASLLVF